jgi:hypothetical protein
VAVRLWLCCALLAVTGCGGSGVARPADNFPAACRKLDTHQRVRVLCPRSLPDPGRGHVLVDSGCTYLVELMARRFDKSGKRPFHMLFGGRCRPYSLATKNRHWPRSPQEGADGMGLVVRGSFRPGQKKAPLESPRAIERLSVSGEPALLCAVAPYPDGGIHGGHYVLIWNQRHAGYVMSFHYPRGDRREPPRGSDVRALRRAAESMAAPR